MKVEDMQSLIKRRTRGFYERVIAPYGMYDKEGDIELAEKYLLFQFNNSSSPVEWMFNFLKGIEETETEIALHFRELKPFNVEISNSLQYVKMFSIVDAFNITTYPPFSEDKLRSL